MSKRAALILLLGVALRVSLFYAVPRDPMKGDVYHHVRLAYNMLQGNGFSHGAAPPYYPDAQRAPLLPVCLALVIALGGGPLQMMLFQCLLDVGTGLLLYGRLRRYDERWATLALGLYMLAPYPAYFPSLEMTECLAVFFFTLTLERSWRLVEDPGLRNALFQGLAATGLAYSRPAMIPIALLLILGTARRKNLLLALATMALLLTPWSLRNASLPGGGFSPLTPASGGVTLWWGVTLDREVNLTRGQGRDLLDRYLDQWRPPRDLSSQEAIEIDRSLKKIAVQAILQHPGQYLGHVVMQAGRLWLLSDDALINAPSTDQARKDALTLVNVWTQRILVVLALVGLCQRKAWPAWLILLGLTAFYSLIHVEPRYMLPAEPILAAAAASVFRRSPAGNAQSCREQPMQRQ